MKMYQPYTTDMAINGAKMARNSMRAKLWADVKMAHRWLCHPERKCNDGCDDRPIPERLALYESDIED